MTSENTKDKLLAAVGEILEEGASPDKLTVRAIAARAKVNPAMVNYCFGSKDELIRQAVDKIVEGAFELHDTIDTDPSDPAGQLKELLFSVSREMLKYRELTRLSIPYLLFEDKIRLPLDLLPYVDKACGERFTEKQKRMVVFELVSSLQLIFYRLEDFRDYSGIDIENEEDLREFIGFQFDLLTGNTNEKS